MTFFRATSALMAVLLAMDGANAWTSMTPMSSKAIRTVPMTTTTRTTTQARIPTALSMAEGDEEDKEFLTKSVKKQIAFDEASGRFFETGIDDADCIPDEEFCAIDQDSGELIRLTTAEKERMFLDALQSYYVNGRQVLNDDDFDKLKEDLAWSGSSVVEMNRKEATYVAAVEAYMKGSPILSDIEFDNLKKELMDSESKFAVSIEPKCYIDTGICKVTFQEDFFRSNLLYLPAGILLSLVWLGIGFELIEPVIRLNPLILAALGSPLIYNGSKTITEDFIFTNKKIAYGPCPTCGTNNRIYFGNILGVEGFDDVAEFKCSNCKSEITVQRNTLRASSLPKA